MSKNYGSLLGGELITLSGVLFQENDIIFCRFGRADDKGYYINEKQVMCVTPPVESERMVDFELKIVRPTSFQFGGASFRFGKNWVNKR